MCNWDNKFLKKCKDIGILISMYFRYVDDVVVFCPEIDPNWLLDSKSKKMTYQPNNQYSELPPDQRTKTPMVGPQFWTLKYG